MHLNLSNNGIYALVFLPKVPFVRTLAKLTRLTRLSLQHNRYGSSDESPLALLLPALSRMGAWRTWTWTPQQGTWLRCGHTSSSCARCSTWV
jgi:hypothetical protein